MPIRAILHPTDFSECSRFAFQLMENLAREEGSPVVVFASANILDV